MPQRAPASDAVAPHSCGSNNGAACAAGADAASNAIAIQESWLTQGTMGCSLPEPADIGLTTSTDTLCGMKSMNRTQFDAIDDIPAMPIADASVRAATHVAALPRDAVASA